MANLPEGVTSLLDTDLYKLTMQCAVLKHFRSVHVTYAFTNRTPHMHFTRDTYEWMVVQIQKLANISLSAQELEYLQQTCPYLNNDYLQFLGTFRFRPSEHVEIAFQPVDDSTGDRELGQLKLTVKGLWLDTILYEIPLLAITSEAYFKFRDRAWTYDSQEEKAFAKGQKMIGHGCTFSEFGTRRRRDYHTQDLVIQGLVRASRETTASQGSLGALGGTSNVHFAMKYGIAPIGTVAHEWFMGIAADFDDYEHASELGLRYWTDTFGLGVLGIALTDTFGTPTFLKAFRQPYPGSFIQTNEPIAASPPSSVKVATDGEAEKTSVKEGKPTGQQTYAQVFAGVRQDSGDPANFVKAMREFYDHEGIEEPKSIVFSDSLNIDLCLEYKQITEAARLKPSFGIGTFLTNDFINVSNGKKSVPLNIVIKLSSVEGRAAVKISDNIGKNTGDQQTVSKVKERLGYTEKLWAGGDEKTRWGKA